jgi:hypothetical protein
MRIVTPDDLARAAEHATRTRERSRELVARALAEHHASVRDRARVARHRARIRSEQLAGTGRPEDPLPVAASMGSARSVGGGSFGHHPGEWGGSA